MINMIACDLNCVHTGKPGEEVAKRRSTEAVLDDALAVPCEIEEILRQVLVVLAAFEGHPA